jgi:hypothetical protein
MVQNFSGTPYGKVLLGIAILLILFIISAYVDLRFGPVPVAVADPAFPLKNQSSGLRLEHVPLVRIKALLLLSVKMYLNRARGFIGSTVQCATVIRATILHLPAKCSRPHLNSGKRMVLMVWLA